MRNWRTVLCESQEDSELLGITVLYLYPLPPTTSVQLSHPELLLVARVRTIPFHRPFNTIHQRIDGQYRTQSSWTILLHVIVVTFVIKDGSFNCEQWRMISSFKISHGKEFHLNHFFSVGDELPQHLSKTFEIEKRGVTIPIMLFLNCHISYNIDNMFRNTITRQSVHIFQS